MRSPRFSLRLKLEYPRPRDESNTDDVKYCSNAVYGTVVGDSRFVVHYHDLNSTDDAEFTGLLQEKLRTENGRVRFPRVTGRKTTRKLEPNSPDLSSGGWMRNGWNKRYMLVWESPASAPTLLAGLGARRIS